MEAFAEKLSGMGLCERTLGERSVLQMERLRAERGAGCRPSDPLQGDLLRLRWSVGDPDKLLRPVAASVPVLLYPGLSQAFGCALRRLFPGAGRQMESDFAGPSATSTISRLGLGTLAVFWVTGTAIIVIHELGHGFTCKYFGGQVHEIGAMLIYFELAFFCNVNDAWTFPEREARLWVTAAGSWIQLVLASLAAVVWWAATPEPCGRAAFAGGPHRRHRHRFHERQSSHSARWLLRAQ